MSKKSAVYASLAAEFLEQSDDMPCGEEILQELLSKLPEQQQNTPKIKLTPHQEDFCPQTLNDFLAAFPPQKSWQQIGGSLRQLPLAKGFNGATCKIMGVKAGHTIPKHTHKGDEFVLVLQGGLSDHRGTLRRGDFIYSDATVEHTPVAEMGEECICLVVTHGKLKFTGVFGRILNLYQST